MKKTLLFITLFQFAINLSYSTNSVLNLEIKDVIPEISDENILCIYRDKPGFLWIGTYAGLYRSDGTNTQVYLNNPTDSLSISSSIVYKIFEDNSGTLWFGTQSGLDQYNYQTGTFTRHLPVKLIPNKNIIEIRDIAQDSNDNLWLATYNHHGLIRYNAKNKQTKTYWLPVNNEQRLNAVEVNNNNVWIGSEIFGLFVLNTLTDTIKSIKSDINNSSFTINDIKTVDDLLWIGSWKNGLIKYNPQSDKFIFFDKEKNFSGKNIRQIFVDENKNLWLAVFEGGLNFFNTKTQNVSIIENKNSKGSINKQLLSWSIFIDKQNILWLGTLESGIKKAFLNSLKYNLLSYQDNGVTKNIIKVNDALQDKANNLWIGSGSQGLIKYNLDTKKGKQINLAVHLSYFQIIALALDKLNRLWVATNKGIYIINPNTNQIITHLTNNNSFLKVLINPINFVYSSPDGDIWLSAWQEGIIHIPFSQLKTENPLNYHTKRYLQSKNGLHNNNVTNIYQIADSSVLISGTYFIQKFNKYTLMFEDFAVHDGSFMCEDENNNLWISSTRGISTYKDGAATTKIKSYNFNETSAAMDIFPNNKYIWINKKDELLRLNTTTNQIDEFKLDGGG